MYTLTYKENHSPLETLGTFEDWAGLAKLIVKECTLINDENAEDYKEFLLLTLSCWTLKLMASEIVSFDTLDGENLIFSYPEAGAGRWTIELI
jgi:hypothetical protein